MPLDFPGLRGIVEGKRIYGSVAEHSRTSRAKTPQPARIDAGPDPNSREGRARQEI